MLFGKLVEEVLKKQGEEEDALAEIEQALRAAYKKEKTETVGRIELIKKESCAK